MRRLIRRLGGVAVGSFPFTPQTEAHHVTNQNVTQERDPNPIR